MATAPWYTNQYRCLAWIVTLQRSGGIPPIQVASGSFPCFSRNVRPRCLKLTFVRTPATCSHTISPRSTASSQIVRHGQVALHASMTSSQARGRAAAHSTRSEHQGLRRVGHGGLRSRLRRILVDFAGRRITLAIPVPTLSPACSPETRTKQFNSSDIVLVTQLFRHRDGGHLIEQVLELHHGLEPLRKQVLV